MPPRLRAIWRRLPQPHSRSLACATHRCHFSSSFNRNKVSDPLRILFCGSDEFSIAALEALNSEKRAKNDLVRSLDVVVRPGKLTGRGMKTIRQVPLEMTARRLGLPVHQLNTFTGWTPPFEFNLIIAVSFGLLVPPRLLRQAKYGGLNLHPSLLPDLRGPAPLHHTLLLNRPFTGVTLQTLHESRFDHGFVLAQTPRPGIPVPEDATLQGLHSLVTPIAAEMLVRGLREGVHVPPLNPVGWVPSEAESKNLSHAPKFTKLDRQIQWQDWEADDFSRRFRTLGPLWSEVIGKDGIRKRAIFDEIPTSPHLSEKETRLVESCFANTSIKSDHSDAHLPPLGKLPMLRSVSFANSGSSSPADGPPTHDQHVRIPYFETQGKGGAVFILTPRGHVLKIPSIKVEGDKSKPAAVALAPFSEAI